nr:MAG TPA: hypothetical protein [Caudoviricetes sp.]
MTAYILSVSAAKSKPFMSGSSRRSGTAANLRTVYRLSFGEKTAHRGLSV